MSIYFVDAFKNISTERYNRQSIYLFMAVYVILAAIYAGFDKSMPVISIAASFIISILANGVYYLAINNSIFNKDNIFPDIRTDAESIILIAFKYILGIIGYCILAVLIFIPLLFSYKLSIGLGIFITILYLLFWFVLFFGINFNFSLTLKLKDMYNLKKAFKFLKEARKSIFPYIGNAIIIGTICIAIMSLILIAVVIIATIIIFLAKIDYTEVQTVMYIIGSIIGAFGTIFGSLLMIDLTGQFYNEVIEKVKMEQSEAVTQDNI